MNEVETQDQQKVLSREVLADVLREQRARGKRIIFTNGCFDLLHLGHVRYLQAARALGDMLVIGLNSDESTHRLKGAGRPLVPEDERAEILAALECVSYVTVFVEPTAEALVDLLRPDIYVKGGDYAGAQGEAPDTRRLPEARVVAAYGGSVRLIPYMADHSTSELIAKMKQLS